MKQRLDKIKETSTHSLEKGTDIRYIQTLLDHKQLKTTEIYTHVSRSALEQPGSPFDDLEIKRNKHVHNCLFFTTKRNNSSPTR